MTAVKKSTVKCPKGGKVLYSREEVSWLWPIVQMVRISYAACFVLSLALGAAYIDMWLTGKAASAGYAFLFSVSTGVFFLVHLVKKSVSEDISEPTSASKKISDKNTFACRNEENSCDERGGECECGTECKCKKNGSWRGKCCKASGRGAVDLACDPKTGKLILDQAAPSKISRLKREARDLLRGQSTPFLFGGLCGKEPLAGGLCGKELLAGGLCG